MEGGDSFGVVYKMNLIKNHVVFVLHCFYFIFKMDVTFLFYRE